MPFLNETQTELVLRKLAPLGRVPKYDGKSLTLSETPARRFILDQTIARQRPRSRALIEKSAYDPSYIGIGFTEAIATLIQDDYSAYKSLFELILTIDRAACKNGMSCEQAAVLLSHESFGPELFPHIHARSTFNGPTVSCFINLTGDEPSVISLYKRLDESSRAFQRGYTDHRLMAIEARHEPEVIVQLFSNTKIVFDAAHTPHKYSYGKDLWLTVVYDQTDEDMPPALSIQPLLT